jgi:hypothetical protein
MENQTISEILELSKKLGVALEDEELKTLETELSEPELQSHLDEIKSDINTLVRWKARLKMQNIEPAIQVGNGKIHDTEETRFMAVLNQYSLARKDPGQLYSVKLTFPLLKYMDICIGLTDQFNTHGAGYFILQLEDRYMDYNNCLIDISKMKYKYYTMKEISSVLSALQYNYKLGIENNTERKMMILEINDICDDIMERLSELKETPGKLTKEQSEDLKSMLKEFIKLKITDEAVTKMKGNFFGITSSDRKAILKDIDEKSDSVAEVLAKSKSKLGTTIKDIENIKVNGILKDIKYGKTVGIELRVNI